MEKIRSAGGSKTLYTDRFIPYVVVMPESLYFTLHPCKVTLRHIRVLDVLCIRAHN